MNKKVSFLARIFVVFSLFTNSVFAADKEEEKFDPVPTIMHHIQDAHDWHIMDIEGEDGQEKPISIPLPVILIDEGVQFFMSSSFHHGEEVAKDQYFLYHEHVYKLDENKLIYLTRDIPQFDEEGSTKTDTVRTLTFEEFQSEFSHDGHLELPEGMGIANAQPIDLSITKNVATLFIVALIVFLIFTSVAKYYKKNGAVAPSGLTSFMEPLILFVRDNIAKENIGPKYEKFMPYLLTVFFFIWIANLMGLVPFFPGGANLTGNIAVTMVLAMFTLVITNINGNKHYWRHIFWMPGVPVPVRILLMPIELVGVITKPFALMIRLFANITAGHIIVLSLVSIIFIFKTAWMGALSIPMTLFISVLELLVAALQAFIFTMLSALFIGSAVAEHHDH